MILKRFPQNLNPLSSSFCKSFVVNNHNLNNHITNSNKNMKNNSLNNMFNNKKKLYFFNNKTNKNEILILDKQIGKGGEGTVFLINNLQNKYVAKIYHKITPNLENKIKYMINNKPDIITGNTFIICWPEYIIYDDNNKFIGYIMKKGFNDSIEVYELTKPKVKNAKFYKFSNNHKNVLINKLKLIINICVPLNHISNTKKYVMVDFKPQNILTDVNGKISILDTDSFQISENNKILFNARVATPEYTPKEYANVAPASIKYNEATDMFAIAVSFYQILNGIHPYVIKPKNNNLNTIAEYIYADLFAFGNNQSNIISKPPPHSNFINLHQNIQNLFIKTFTSIHRPKVSEWGENVTIAINELVQNYNSKSTINTNNNVPKKINNTAYNDFQTYEKVKFDTITPQKSSPIHSLALLRTSVETVKKLMTIAKKAKHIGDVTDELAYKKMILPVRCAMFITYLYTIEYDYRKDINGIDEFIHIVNEIFLDDLTCNIDTKKLYLLCKHDVFSINMPTIIHEIKSNFNNISPSIYNIDKFLDNKYNEFCIINSKIIDNILNKYNKEQGIDIDSITKILIGCLNANYTYIHKDIDSEDSDYKKIL